jgi:hypothetical protein
MHMYPVHFDSVHHYVAVHCTYELHSSILSYTMTVHMDSIYHAAISCAHGL